jgi:3-oxoacyl-[acyl-carrier protein] reductase
MALEFSARRAEVALTGRSAEKAAEVAAELEAEVRETRPDAGDPKIVGVGCEVTELDSVRGAVEEVSAKLEGLTDVVANAGTGGRYGRFDHHTPEQWRETFSINLFGTYHTFLACVQPILENGGGRLVGVSGYGAVRAVPYVSPYSSAKAAVIQLVRTLAREFEQHPLRFLVFSPGILERGLTTEVDLVEEDAHHYTNPYAKALREYLRKPLPEAARLAANIVDPANPLPSGQKVALHKPFEVTWAMAKARIKSLKPG